MEFIISILIGAVHAGTPILIATLGEIITERSGVLNIGIEGLMLVGALFGFMVSRITGSPWLGVLAACTAGALLSMLHALLSVGFGANQVVSGLILNFIGIGLSSVIGAKFVGQTATGFSTFPLGPLANIPVLGRILFNQDALVYCSFILTLLVSILIYKTRTGITIRAVGDSPSAADSRGISVLTTRTACVIAGGALCGLSGAYISLAYTTLWQPGMTGGKGWIVVALVIFARWNPIKAMYGAYLFGGITALQLALQTQGTTISSHFLQMLPYVFTIFVLALAMWKNKQRGDSLASAVGPASLATPYSREQ